MASNAAQELTAFTDKLQRIRFGCLSDLTLCSAVFLNAGGFLASDIQSTPPSSDNTWESLVASFQVGCVIAAHVQNATKMLLDTEHQADRFLREMMCEHTSAPAVPKVRDYFQGAVCSDVAACELWGRRLRREES